MTDEERKARKRKMKTAARKRAEKCMMLWVRTYETEDALVITIRAAKRKQAEK